MNRRAISHTGQEIESTLLFLYGKMFKNDEYFNNFILYPLNKREHTSQTVFQELEWEQIQIQLNNNKIQY